jgi:2-methylisocitrate lyase-like PEP mutase family enzyme
MTQHEKAEKLRALHQGPRTFWIPNPWDAGSAKLFASLGFEALTTTSAGLAWVIGKADGGVTREDSLANARMIVEAVDLPVAADLENGFGDRPEDAALTIRRAADVGLVGGSIEDYSGNPERPIYDFSLAVERVAAAAEAAHSLAIPFQFVARCENWLHGVADLDDTIRRLQAYEKAGADVLFPPGLKSLDDIRTVCQSVSKPVNIVVGPPDCRHSIADLAACGVKRVSLGGSLARAAYTAARTAAEELLGPGTLTFIKSIMTTADLNKVMTRQIEP